jgi:hypothetical protein
MKALYCSCGHRVFFDSMSCVACGAALGFDPQVLAMRSLDVAGAGFWQADDGARFRLCANRHPWSICNWLVAPKEETTLCRSCRLTELLPNLERLGNILLWGRMELAKRRLLYTLMTLGLPLAWGEGAGLRFRFLEDQRRNPDVFEDFVTTGHAAGTITINLAEASDVERHQAREEMQERYRTPLGHLRHETGHYYFDWLLAEPGARERFRELFGDERTDYAAALQRHYAEGPPANWRAHFVSAYAAAHPHENWAESFAHFLHIVDMLETARTFRLARPGGEWPDEEWLSEWSELAVALNELNRSLGLEDAYPFVLTAEVYERLEFIRRRVARAVQPGLAGAAVPQMHS